MQSTPQNHLTFESERCVPVANESPIPHLTADARRYALKELARRAGVPKTFFDTWKIESSSASTIASFSVGPVCKIEFVHQPDTRLEKLAEVPVARVDWPDLPSSA